jgi:hypothetical protein
MLAESSQPRETFERLGRFHLAADRPLEKLGNVHAPVGGLGLEDPALRLADPHGKLSLRQPRARAHLRQQPGNLAINRCELTLGHADGLSARNMLESEWDSDRIALAAIVAANSMGGK